MTQTAKDILSEVDEFGRAYFHPMTYNALNFPINNEGNPDVEKIEELRRDYKRLRSMFKNPYLCGHGMEPHGAGYDAGVTKIFIALLKRHKEDSSKPLEITVDEITQAMQKLRMDAIPELEHLADIITGEV